MGSTDNYPLPENMGENCMYWTLENGCAYPKYEVQGRRSCEGIIDDVCLFMRGKISELIHISPIEAQAMKTNPFPDATTLPPGDY
jgi:hypothetical protein